MAIRFISGLPRAGKTFNVVQNYLIPALDDNRHIVTNILLRLDTIYKLYPKASITYFDKSAPLRKDSNVDQYLNLDNYPAGSVFLIDEFWRYIESGTRQDKMPESVKSFFTEHGHCVSNKGFTTEIILISQSASHVNSFVKSLIDETIFIEKQEELGKPFYICNFHDYFYNHLESSAKPKTVSRGYYDVKHKQHPVGDFYVSHTKNQQTEFNKGLEKKIDSRSNQLNKPIIKYGLPASFVALAFGLYHALTFLGFIETETKEVTKTESIAEQTVIENESQTTNDFQILDIPKPTERAFSNLSAEWKLSGYMIGEKKSVAIIENRSGITRKISFNDNCTKSMITSEVSCSLSGDTITRWSGANTRNYSKNIVAQTFSVDKN